MHTIEEWTPGDQLAVMKKGRTMYVFLLNRPTAGLLVWVRFDKYNMVRMRRLGDRSDRLYVNYKICMDAESLMRKMMRAGRPLRVCVYDMDISKLEMICSTIAEDRAPNVCDTGRT